MKISAKFIISLFILLLLKKLKNSQILFELIYLMEHQRIIKFKIHKKPLKQPFRWFVQLLQQKRDARKKQKQTNRTRKSQDIE